jgi:hypothetical protein
MGRRIAMLVPCLGLSVLAAAEQLPTWQQFPSRNRPLEHVMVQFTDSTLHPSIAQLLKGGSLSWVNYASMSQGSIVLSDAVAKSFTCSDLGPNWIKIDTGYQSIPITIGGALSDLELPCPLEPGDYEYEIWLFATEVDDPAAEEEPQSRMQGKIVVE